MNTRASLCVIACALTCASLMGCGHRRSLVNQPLTPLTEAQMKGRYADHTQRDRIVIANYGDAGQGDETQQRVAELMHAVCALEGCHFAMANGDNIYNHGVSSADDPKFFTHFEGIYRAFGRFDFWSVLGNHDWRSDAQEEVNHTLRSERWRMPHGWFSIPALPSWLTIYGLETTLIHRADELDPAAKARLATQEADARAALCGSEAKWKVVFGHHFTYTSSKRRIHDDYSRMRAFVHPLMQDCGVQIMSAGHDHHLELLEIDEKAGVHPPYLQIISGAGGRHLRDVLIGDQVPARPGITQLFAQSRFGFTLLVFTPEALTVEFYSLDPEAEDPSPTHPDRLKPVFSRTWERAAFAPSR